MTFALILDDSATSTLQEQGAVGNSGQETEEEVKYSEEQLVVKANEVQLGSWRSRRKEFQETKDPEDRQDGAYPSSQH